jgi:hypothetical protein
MLFTYVGPVYIEDSVRRTLLHTCPQYGLCARNRRECSKGQPISTRSVSSIYSAAYINAIELHGFGTVTVPEINVGEALVPTRRFIRRSMGGMCKYNIST